MRKIDPVRHLDEDPSAATCCRWRGNTLAPLAPSPPIPPLGGRGGAWWCLRPLSLPQHLLGDLPSQGSSGPSQRYIQQNGLAMKTNQMRLNELQADNGFLIPIADHPFGSITQPSDSRPRRRRLRQPCLAGARSGCVAAGPTIWGGSITLGVQNSTSIAKSNIDLSLMGEDEARPGGLSHASRRSPIASQFELSAVPGDLVLCETMATRHVGGNHHDQY
jgi:hypothetical protein